MDAWMVNFILTPGKTEILLLFKLKETKRFLTLSGALVFVWFWGLKKYLDPEMLMASVSYTQKADSLEKISLTSWTSYQKTS